MRSGYKGVDIFFVISGFVMYYSTFITHQKNALHFAVNRLTKIYILYWIVLLLLYLVKPYHIGPPFIKTFLLLPTHTPVLNVSWSLSFELYFYFLFAFIAYAVNNKYYKTIFLSLVIISTFITLLNTTSLTIKGSIANFLLGHNLWEFLLGILSAFLFQKTYKKINLVALTTIAIAAALLFTILKIDFSSPYAPIAYGLLSFLIVTTITYCEKIVQPNQKQLRLFKILGDSSYAMYLIAPLIAIIFPAADAISKIKIIVLSIGFSILLHEIFERNLLRISRVILLRFAERMLMLFKAGKSGNQQK